MSLINLSVEEMVFVSGEWTQPGPAHDLLASLPELSGWLPRVEAVHEQLLTSYSKEDPGAQELSLAAADVDATDDNS